MTLEDISSDKSVTVKSVGGTTILRRRLLDMGITPRTRITLVKKAPMGDPLVLSLRGYELTLRKEDAARIEVDEDL